MSRQIDFKFTISEDSDLAGISISCEEEPVTWETMTETEQKKAVLAFAQFCSMFSKFMEHSKEIN